MPRSRKPKYSAQAQAINRVRGADNKIAALNRARRYANVELLQPLSEWSFGWLSTLGVLGSLAPKKLTDLHAVGALPPVDLQREIEWALGLYAKKKALIEKYLIIKSDFDASLAVCDAKKALDIAANSSAQVGHTLLFLSAQIALTQIVHGLEAQKELVAQLRERGASEIVRFLAFWWSVRAEERTSAANFAAYVDQHLTSWDVDNDIRAHLEYQLLNALPTPGLEHAVLGMSTATSVVDSYEAFVALGTSSICEGRPSAAQFADGMRRLSASVADSRIERLLLLSTDDARFAPVQVDIRNREIELIGQHNASSVGAAAYEELFASCAGFHLTGSGEAEDFRDKIRMNLSHALKPGQQAIDAAKGLQKTSLMLGHTSLGRWLAAVASTYAPRSRPFSGAHDGVRFVNSSDALLEAFSVLTAARAEKYAEHIASLYPGSGVSCAAHLLAARGQGAFGSLTDEAAAHCSLWGAVVSADPETILRATNANSTTREAVFCRHAALIELGRVEEALTGAVDLLLADTEHHTSIPLEHLVARVYQADENQFPQLIETPILFAMCAELVDQEFASYRSYTAEDYVFSLGVSRPSEMDGELLTDPRALFFLREVCTTGTLRLFTEFQSARELEDERIAICQMLASADSTKRELYEDEARGIVTSRLVQDALKQLQASKISIDDEAIRAWARRRVGEDFERYKALQASGLAVVDASYREALLRALETGEFAQSLYEVPQNEASVLFGSMVARIVQQCAFDPEHGLDCYLSLRIRHGTMSGILRSAAEKERVVTRRTSDTGDYRPNDFWREMSASSVDADTWDLFEDRLAIFSRELDGLVAETTSKFIQIKREEKPDGLFDLSINPVSIYAMASDLGADTDFDAFVRLCVDLFWVLVSNSLEKIREFLHAETRERFRALFNRLEADIRTEPGLVALADAVLRARNETDISFDRVRGWFELPTPATALAFTINQLIEVALEATRSLHRDFAPILDVPEFDLPPFQGSLNLFSDIFAVIFENVYTHCGSTTPSLSIRAEISDGMLRVRVENSIAPEARDEELTARLQKSREKIAAGAYLYDVSREGGTGLPKLAKLVNYRDGRGSIEFGLESEARTFWIELGLQARVLERAAPEDSRAVACG